MKKLLVKTPKFLFRDYLTIILGITIYCVGLTGFLIPNKIVTGGMAGISLLLNFGFNIPLWITFAVLNTLLLLLAWKILGFQYVQKTIFGVVAITLILSVTEKLITHALISADPLLSSIIGAIFCGVGLGLVYSVNGSTGGTDIIGAIVTKYRYISMGRGLMYVDVLIVSSSYLLFQSLEKIIYGLIIIAVLFSTADMIINGMRQSVQFLIFSSRYDEIASAINSQLGRGVTVLDGVGWYSKKPSKVLVVLARKTESTSIFRLVKQIDENAFISQSNVVGVYGKGFDKMK